ncbi:MAG: ABC transporter substrate-binding protein [Gammaproteobacteria bacterium]
MVRQIVVVVTAFLILASAHPVTAQSSQPVRIGTLLSGSPASHGHYLDGFRQGLNYLGYKEGKNIVIVSRWGRGKRKQLPRLARELVEAKVKVIMVVGRAALEAAAKATQTIPIVTGVVANLAKYEGFVGSLTHPGGNVTGSTFDAIALNGKRLGLIRETLPGAGRVAILVRSLSSKRILRQLKRAKTAGKALGFKIQAREAQSLNEIERAFAKMATENTDALIVNTSTEYNFHRNRIAALAIAKKIPTMCEQTAFVPAGCLMAYTVDRRHMLLRAAVFADKIIKGAKPADLPVEMATRYRLVVNLKTAKTIGITLPPSTLLQATEVME